MPGASNQPAQSNYLDFELEIDAGRGREYPVAVLESPAGEARATMHFPFDELALENRLLSLQNALLRSGGEPRRTLSAEEQAVQDFGREMFEALFTPQVRSCYDVSLREAAQQRKGLRLKLRIHPPELAALPWEYLYHPGQGEYVSLSTRTPVVRYLEVARRIQPLTVTPPLRILGMIASPDDLPGLDVTREKQRIENAIQDLRRRGLAELEWLPGQSWRHLLRAMRGGPWHIFHFVGHGGFDQHAGEGCIALANQEGRAAHFSATQLGRLLADHTSLRLVLLNSCEGAKSSERDIFSSTAAVLVRRGIPAVLAMQYPITDRAAIEFARIFYEALGDGMPVDGAMAEARKAISFAVTNTVEWGTPVLYLRSPDGMLFHVSAEHRDVPPTPGTPPAPSLSAEELEQIYVDGLDALWSEDWDTAVHSFRSIVDARPDYRDATANLQKAEQRKELYTLYAQARAAQESEDWAGALSALEKLEVKAPGFKDAAVLVETVRTQKQLAELYSQAQQLHQAGRWQAIVNIFAQITILDPKYPDPDELLLAAQRGVEEGERQERLNELYGRALLEMEAAHWSEARTLLAQVQEMDESYRGSERMLARVEAEIEREQAERRSQEQVVALYDQAIAQADHAQWRQALNTMDTIQGADPQFEDPQGIAAKAREQVARQQGVDALYDQAIAQAADGQWRQALNTMDKIQGADPQFEDPQGIAAQAREQVARQQRVDALYAQAQAAREAGDWAEAVSSLKELVAEAPEFRDAAAQLEVAKKQKHLASTEPPTQAEGQHREKGSGVDIRAITSPRLLLWSCVPVVTLLLNLWDPMGLYGPKYRYDTVPEPFHLLCATLMPALLPLAVGLRNVIPEILSRSLAFVGVVMTLFWVAVPIVMGSMGGLTGGTEEIVFPSIAVLIGAAILSPFYARFVHDWAKTQVDRFRN